MNYIGRFRSNYFAVKDRDAFEQWCRQYHLELITENSDPSLVGFHDRSGEGIPTHKPAETEDEDEEEIDFIEELGEQLADGYVAVVMEIGWEGYRYLVGNAYAINNQGECRNIILDDEIDRQARALGKYVTPCQY